jgi:phosphoglucosamine mutase
MMQAKDAVIGGEASGHTIFLDHHTTGDGIVTALQLLAALRAAGESLSVAAKLMRLSPQNMINLDVVRKPPLEELPELRAAVAEAEAELGDKGRVLIRYSGTQSMCRVMVEGPTEEMTLRLTQALAETVRNCIG